MHKRKRFMDHGKPVKSWSTIISFCRPVNSWNLGVSHTETWEIS